MRHLEQSKFEMETLLLLISQLAVSAEHDLQMPREIFFSEHFRDTRDTLAFFTRNLQQRRILAGDFCDGRIAQEPDHLAGEVGRAMTFADEMVNLAKNFFAPAL